MSTIQDGKSLRTAYLEYFRTLSDFPHPVVPSAPLVPPDDPTLLFTSAGMVQFKALYSGTVELPYPRAASCQKCLRAGGKGSDLENVGKTLRHHTFFEMLGNFSFGDYFKRETIRFAWEFCTSPKWMGLPKERMFPTIYGPTTAEIDEEAIQYYREETDCPNPLIPLDASENFWGPAGETGACGPCSEVKFFLGSDEELAAIQKDLRENGDEAVRRLGRRVVEEGDLFLEIWNMVFPQFDQQRDGTRLPLKNKGIDTGAGLERMTVALTFARTGKLSTPYETDLMWPITKAVAEALFGNVDPERGYPTTAWLVERAAYRIDQLEKLLNENDKRIIHDYVGDDSWRQPGPWISVEVPEARTRLFSLAAGNADHADSTAREAFYRLSQPFVIGDAIRDFSELARLNGRRLAVNAIADHVRTLVFCLSEGLTPGNVGRRYVVRRIQRRALRFAAMQGSDKPFMADLYEAVVEAMGDAYPEIKKNPDFIKRALRQEEETFLRTRDRGMKILNDLIAEAISNGTNIIPGEGIFRLWDTYGFPVDMTVEIVEDRGLHADVDGYVAAMKRQKEEAKKSWKGAKLDFNEEALDPIYEEHGATDFVGYEIVAPVETALLGIVPVGDGSADELQAGGEALLVLRSTPFYAEGGGQVGDTGRITTVDGAVFVVTDTQKSPQGLFLHRGKLERGLLRPGATVTATIDRERRHRIIRNHSSVHLLQSALKRIVGDHITQAGSFVGPDSSRFDFTHGEAISRETLMQIQREVNRLILKNAPVVTEVLSLEEAKAKGAIAPFGEKYGAVVRVVSMGPESIEFCGGTHAPSTGYIARYRIVSEASIASGVRRIEAVTGDAALESELDEQYHLVAPLQNLLAAKGPEALQRVGQLQDRLKDLEREVARLKREVALREVDGLLAKATDLNGARVVVGRLDGLEGNELRTVAMALRDRLGESGVAALISEVDGKVAIVAASGKEAQKAFPAGTVVNKLAAPLGGKGGGKPDMAQAGAKDASRINEVISGALGLLA